MTRTVIFDLDGTIADTSADLIAAANACFRGLGHGDLLHPEDDALTAFHGGRAMLRLGFGRVSKNWTEMLVDEQYPLLLQAYAEEIATHTRLYPGVENAVTRLSDAGYRLGVCTNKPEGLAETLLRQLRFRDVFASLVGADTLPVRKPDPLPYRTAVERAGGVVERSMLVGDTVTDRDTARAAGVPVALITFGPSGREVEQLEPEALLDHFDQLFDLAEILID
ncbi:HAD-IA family hydrolase [Halodurantibacterium flavum]|uniref:phosphoglycolate phosphatase n=1 Tax=Halodurantibacterium flavum TaxID=1382802 RepID=A0ABW4S304_9RHOB